MPERDPKDPIGGGGGGGTPPPEQPSPDEAPFAGIVTGADVEAAVRGATFPSTSKDLIERARQNGAEEHVLARLSELPERRFTSLGDALRQLDMLS